MIYLARLVNDQGEAMQKYDLPGSIEYSLKDGNWSLKDGISWCYNRVLKEI